MNRSWLTFAAALVTIMALPATAFGATYKLDAGYDGLPRAPKPTAPLKFYPSAVSVHPGDEVAWNIKGFHTVTALKRGQKVPRFDAPSPIKITGFNDANGVPFWFNGLPYADQSPEAKVTSAPGQDYAADKYLNSGNPFLGPAAPKAFSMKFPKTGTFTYYCITHPGMVGSVKVLPKSKKVASPAKVAARKRAEERKDAKVAQRVAKRKGARNTVYIARQSKDGVSVNRFFPKTLSVSAGTTVKLTSRDNPISEAHVLTFGPQGPQLKSTIGGAPIPGQPGAFALSPYIGPYPSEPSVKNLTYDGTNHGDGFLNLGFLTRDVPDISIKFTKAGTYNYLCVFHPGMDGQIVVK